LGLPASRVKKAKNVSSLQAILLVHGEQLINKYMLPKRVFEAIQAIVHCRTAAMGGHVERCPEGHIQRTWYNSCKHRSCPKCGHLPRQRWLDKQEHRLLDCDHHHVIFTIPPELHVVWRYNRELMMDLLFHVVRDTLLVLLGSERYGGLLPGMMCNLHTWGRNLHLHPHLHCLITAGGLNKAGEWVQAKKADLLPYRVVRELYRGKMIAAVRDALRAGKLALPPTLPAFRLENTLNRLGRESWNVEICERYSHGKGVLMYLAGYVRGGPISDSRILSSDSNSVSFEYFDHRDKTTKVMTLSPEAFLLRALQHVPPPRKKMVRYYGLYAEHNVELLNISRATLGQPKIEPAEFMTWEAFWETKDGGLPNLCPVCGKKLVPVGRLRRWNTYHPGIMGQDDQAA
jgi:Putative transposase/Transposase zinc-binding domain